ncbi:MAG: DNA polymerase III subunit delta' [Moraxella sp.]|nr:DNA polymerase III subunit delta' [Moraxella sp.]
MAKASTKRSKNTETAHSVGDSSVYFAPLLPWQVSAWEQFVSQHKDGHLPHGLLAAGMAGIGKHAFVWRAVAYQLCHSPSDDGACGMCQSCVWLKAGTHPDLMVLPMDSLPTVVADDTLSNIKIDDVRGLQDFNHLQSRGTRLIVLDRADSLTLGAANALLKTLEEPRAGVHLWLISDNPARLLPTIKSRVQMLPLTHFDSRQGQDYVVKALGVSDDEAHRLMTLADNAPLTAIGLKNARWFGLRTVWLKTFVALQQGKRLPVQASDYWQGELGFDEFCQLTRAMLTELYRVGLQLPSQHTDINTAQLLHNVVLNSQKLEHILNTLDDNSLAIQQNVQDKLAYDDLMVQLAG